MKFAYLLLASMLLGWQAKADTSNEIVLAFAGDIMLDELPGEVIARGRDPFADFTDILKHADLAIGNLECAVSKRGKAADKPFTFRAHPRVLHLLAWHFGAVSLANNHSLDFGYEGLLETTLGLHAAHIDSFGAGKDLAAAHTPRIVLRKGIRIALLGYNEFLPRSFEAGPDHPGVAWSEDEQILRDMRVSRAMGADIIIPVLHWGWEHETLPCPRQRELAHRLIDAGASAVVGGHPHVTQGTEIYKHRPIVYSLGNFVFNSFESEAATTGWVLHMTLTKAGVLRWHTVVARLDQNGLPHMDLTAQSPCGDAFSLYPRDCIAGKAPGTENDRIPHR